ncbi:MAG TPA: VOC family protein [Thermoanaerobaculia bacterium]|nr:VOC family protein [Thermoanaerobaculia bacterium]
MSIRTTTPVFAVADVAATMEWYRDRLGFAGDAVPRKPPYNFAILRRDDVEIMLQRFDGFRLPELYPQRPGGVWNVYLRVEGVQMLYDEFRERVRVLEPLHVQPYGQTEFVVEDLNGYVLVFAEPHEPRR